MDDDNVYGGWSAFFSGPFELLAATDFQVYNSGRLALDRETT